MSKTLLKIGENLMSIGTMTVLLGSLIGFVAAGPAGLIPGVIIGASIGIPIALLGVGIHAYASFFAPQEQKRSAQSESSPRSTTRSENLSSTANTLRATSRAPSASVRQQPKAELVIGSSQTSAPKTERSCFAGIKAMFSGVFGGRTQRNPERVPLLSSSPRFSRSSL